MPLNAWIPGEEVQAVDLNEEYTVFLNLVTIWANMIFGTTSLQPSAGAITPTVTATAGLAGTVNVSGAAYSHNAIIMGRLCVLSQQSFPVALNNSATTVRNDVLYGTWSTAQINPFQRAVRAPDGSISQQTCYQLSHDVAWTYVQGNADGTPGAVPAGTVAILDIAVPIKGGALTATALNVVLPTVGQLLTGLSPYLAGAGINFNPTGSGDIYIANTGVLSLMNQSGNVAMKGGPGISTTVAILGGVPSITITNIGVVSAAAGAGISVSAGPNITITNTGVVSLMGKVGAIVMTGGAGVVITPVVVNGSPGIDIVLDLTSADNSVLIKSTGAALDLGTAQHHYGGAGITDANGYLQIGPLPYQILGATATIQQLSGGLDSYVVFYAGDYTSYPQGIVTFYALNFNLTTGKVTFVGPGVGIAYTILMSNAAVAARTVPSI